MLINLKSTLDKEREKVNWPVEKQFKIKTHEQKLLVIINIYFFYSTKLLYDLKCILKELSVSRTVLEFELINK